MLGKFAKSVGLVLLLINSQMALGQDCQDCHAFFVLIPSNGVVFERGFATESEAQLALGYAASLFYRVISATEACASKTLQSCGTNSICTPSSTVMNDPRAYDCSCTTGNFVERRRSTGYTCEDVDECTNGTANCHAQADCINNPGSYECACSIGYTGDGVVQCTGIHECVTDDECLENAMCISYEGRFVCRCNDGYELQLGLCIGTSGCVADEDCQENAICMSYEGRFVCRCNDGYNLQGSQCVGSSVITTTPTNTTTAILAATTKASILRYAARFPYVNRWLRRWRSSLMCKGNDEAIWRCLFSRMGALFAREDVMKKRRITNDLSY